MKRGKRGPYLNYLQHKRVKVPRQTQWNIRNRENLVNDVVSLDPREHDSNQTDDMNESIVTDYTQTENSTSNIIDDSHYFSDTAATEFFSESNISIVNDYDDSDIESSLVNDLLDDSQSETNFEENETELQYDYFQRIHESLQCTKGDVLSMIYAYSIRHSLNWIAIEDLVRLVNSVVGNESLVPSKYMFKKIFRTSEKFQPTAHFFCHVCGTYLGVKEQLHTSACQSCNSEICTDTKYKKNHFLSIPIENHLKNILEQNVEQLIFETRSPPGDICDVHDSQNFKQLKEKMGNCPYITLTLYTDGAAVFKSTKEKSLWPICLYVNEINLEHRYKRKNILCSTLSFGKTPNMQIIFKPLMNEIERINAKGGVNFLDENGQKKVVKIIPMLFTADALAKADVLHLIQHNGRFGCPYCLHPGTHIEGTKYIRYCNRNCNTNRTNRGARNDMIQAHHSGAIVNGYKGLSPLLAMGNQFDVVWQTVIDKMHCVEMGVIKKMFDLFLNNKYRSERYIDDAFNFGFMTDFN